MPISVKRDKEIETNVPSPAKKQKVALKTYNVPKYDKIILVLLYSSEGETLESANTLKLNAKRLEDKWLKTYHKNNIEIVHYDIVNSNTSLDYALNATAESKVIISAHGCIETNTISDRDPEWVAEIIYDDLEITQAKSMTILACNIGQTDFCAQLKNELISKSDGLFSPAIYGYTLPVMVFTDGNRMADRGENDDSSELEFVPAKLHKKLF